jgi:glycosyltransferase involved in cell wall biosynthesis
MRVVIDARMLLPQQTGVGRYLLGLASALAHIPGDDRFEFWLQSRLPDDHPIFALQNQRVALHKLPIDHLDPRQQWVIPAKLRRERPEVLHYPHFDLPFAVPGAVVATIHDLKFTAGRARCVIAVSESTRADIIRYLHVRGDKIVVVPEGVDAETYRQPVPVELENLRHKYRLATPFILFIGERRLHKNITGSIRAFDLFRKMSASPFQLVIAGKPYADYQEPERLVEALGLEESVRFLNYVPESDLPALYRAAEALLMLSWYEGFGLPVLEAQAAGTPVVAAQTTSLPEVLGEAGLLVPPDQPEQAAEALRQVVSGGSLRQELIERGFEHARQFTWDRCAHETFKIYQSAAGERA